MGLYRKRGQIGPLIFWLALAKKSGHFAMIRLQKISERKIESTGDVQWSIYTAFPSSARGSSNASENSSATVTSPTLSPKPNGTQNGRDDVKAGNVRGHGNSADILPTLQCVFVRCDIVRPCPLLAAHTRFSHSCQRHTLYHKWHSENFPNFLSNLPIFDHMLLGRVLDSLRTLR